MINPKLYLVRGIPGSGKSTYGARLGCYCINPNDQYSICGGEYNFDDDLIAPAHILSLALCNMIMIHKKDIAICEVFLTLESMIDYIKKAKINNYDLTIIDCVCSLDESASSNIHDVPMYKLKNMYENFYLFPTLIEYCEKEDSDLIKSFNYEHIILKRNE